jgi:signal transduction histidine kinase
MQIQFRSAREEVAVNPVLISWPFEGDVGDVQPFERAGLIPRNADQLVRPPQLSRAEQLALSYRAKDARLAVISHELRNSLGVVRNAARLLGAPSAPHSEAGHGIGVAVVRNFVEMHGGCVTATSDGLGRGSEFTVLLPAPRT